MIFICSGAPRSGSTLQYNLVCEILECFHENIRLGFYEILDFSVFKSILFSFKEKKIMVLKTHTIEENFYSKIPKDQVRFFYSFRDIRDVINSHVKKEKINIVETIQNGFIKKYIDDFKLAHLNSNKTYIAKYEIFSNKLIDEIDNISFELNLELSPDEKNQILKKLSLDNVKSKIQVDFLKDESKMKSVKYNPETLFHPNHISSGKHMQFLKDLSKSDIQIIENECSSWLIQNNYILTKFNLDNT